MKKLNVTWEGIHDSTGYLFSFAKALSAAVKNSPYSELAEDVVTTSGFAFRMWVAADDLCPSATSVWEFKKQKPWVENNGLICDYVERLWGQEEIEEARRNEAIAIIKKSIDQGIPAVSWDIGVPEWGLVTGYDEDRHTLSTLSISGSVEEMPYEKLGKRELPLLSVLTVTGKREKDQEEVIHDTLKLAASHLSGEEWCENAKGLEAYPAFIAHFEDKFKEPSWSMEYYLGTYGALKDYARRFFDKYNMTEFSKLYKEISENWMEAFQIKTTRDLMDAHNRIMIAKLLKNAYECEKKALERIQSNSFN